MYKTIVILVCWFRCRFRCQDVHAQISKWSFSWILSVLYGKTGIYCRDENTLWFFTLLTFRSGHRRCSVRKVVLRNFVKFTGKHLCQSFFFSKVAGLRPATLLKKRDSVISVFLRILRNLQEHLFYRAPLDDCP